MKLSLSWIALLCILQPGGTSGMSDVQSASSLDSRFIQDVPLSIINDSVDGNQHSIILQPAVASGKSDVHSASSQETRFIDDINLSLIHDSFDGIDQQKHPQFTILNQA